MPPRTLVRGVPARVARTLSAEEVQEQRERALEYVETSRHYARRSRLVSRAAAGDDDAVAPRRPRRGEKRALQRQRILESARDVFFRDGFMAANLDEVAAGAGVAKGTLYRYFENKAELYVAVLSANGDVFERKMRETIEPALPPAEQVRRLGRFYVEHWTAHREYFQIFWALENEPVIGELPEAVVAQVTALWEQCLRAARGRARARHARRRLRRARFLGGREHPLDARQWPDPARGTPRRRAVCGARRSSRSSRTPSNWCCAVSRPVRAR